MEQSVCQRVRRRHESVGGPHIVKEEATPLATMPIAQRYIVAVSRYPMQSTAGV